MHPDPCAHPQFVAAIKIQWSAPEARYVAEVHITCAACGTPYQQLGAPAIVGLELTALFSGQTPLPVAAVH